MAAIAGRDPRGYQADLGADGAVVVEGPLGRACYPLRNWLSAFAKDLYRGHLDEPPGVHARGDRHADPSAGRSPADTPHRPARRHGQPGDASGDLPRSAPY